MIYAWIFLAVLQQDELQERIAEKRREIWEMEKELRTAEDELSQLTYGCGPGFVVSSAKALYTGWDDSYHLEASPGIGVSCVPARGGEDSMGGVLGLSLYPFTVRYWRAEEERTGEDVDIVSFNFLGLWMEKMFEDSSLGISGSMTWGYTWFDSRDSGGESDVGPNFTAELETKFALSSSSRLGAGLSWDVVRTSFGDGDTHARNSFSALLSVEFSW